MRRPERRASIHSLATFRRAGTALSLIAFAAVLAGCALDEGSGLSPEEARDVFIDVVDRTQVEAGDVWQRQDDPTPRGCTIPLWVDGQRYPALRLAPAPRDSDAVIERVSELWDGLGYHVERSSVGDAVELKAHDDSFDSLILRISSNGMTLQGESECRPAAG